MTTVLRCLAFPLLGFATFGCGTDGPQVEIHESSGISLPDEEQALVYAGNPEEVRVSTPAAPTDFTVDVPATHLDFDAPSRVTPSLPEPALDNWIPRLQLGRLEGSAEEVFGLISDVVLDGDGHAYVADARMLELKRFSAEGELLARAGRAGGGPGEFRFLERIALGPERRLYALDGAHRRISRFSTAAGGLQHLDDILLPLIPQDFCLFGDRIFLVGLYRDRMIHEVDHSGALLRSFATAHLGHELPEGRTRDAYRETMSEGWIACATDAGLVVLVARNRGDVRAFTPEGHLRWSSRLRDFHPMGVRPIRGGFQLAWNPEIDGANHVESVTPTASGHLLVQTSLLRENVTRADAVLRTRVLSLEDGAETDGADGLPFITFASGDRLAGYEILPFPRLVLLHSQELRQHE